jgi:hypothetical protein
MIQQKTIVFALSLFTMVLMPFSDLCAQQGELKRSIAQLKSGKTVKERLEAVNTVEQLAKDELNVKICVAELAAALKDKELRVRQAAAMSLGRLGGRAKTARAALTAALKDKNYGVRSAVNKALSKVITFEGLPTSALLSFFILFIPAVLGVIIVFRIDEQRLGLLNTIAGISFVLTLAKGVLVFVPSLSFFFDGSDAFLYLERDIALPAGIIFCATATRLLPTDRNRRALKIFVGLLLLIQVGQNAWVFTTPGCYKESNGEWVDGVCLQSTNYTCGAASAAVVLRAHGVADAVEHECARLSHTVPGRGVTDLGAARALRMKLPGRRVTLRVSTVEQLKDFNLPCLGSLKFSFWFDHMVAVLAVDERGYWIGDPLKGRVLMSADELKKRWLGRAITVD